jgi:hypothetical protein
VGIRVSRCAWEASYSIDLPSSKPSSAASTLGRIEQSWNVLLLC